MTGTAAFVPAGQVHHSQRNIRRELGDLTELAGSIRAPGILEPLIVRQHPSRAGHFEVIAGNRRLAAARQAGHQRVPVIVLAPSAAARPAEELILVENCQRQGLTMAERAEAMGRLIRERGYTAALISERTGLAPSTVSTCLTLLDLDQGTRDRIHRGDLTVTEAIAGVRQIRKRARTARGEKPRDATWEPEHLAGDHPLAGRARARCDALGHTLRRRIGRTACGECFETVIRDDERARVIAELREDGLRAHALAS